MGLRLVFAGHAWDEYVACQMLDRRSGKKLNALLKDVLRNPTTGIGHPEQLKGEEVLWSRRINEKDRLVYEVHEDEVVIRQCRGHYGDK